ncbi:MAG: hypothetical protein WEC73_00540 [Chthoniobacterales bacterium]
MRVTRFLFAAALGTVCAAGPVGAQLTKPPIASATNVSVWRGDRVPVTLRGFFGNNPVEYSIERAPRHGVLSPIGQPDPDRVSVSTDGSVVYSHDNSEDSMSDEFAFRVRAVRGGGLSAPTTVRITIMDRPPVLAAPSSLEFTAAAGEAMTRSLGLTNAGGGVLEGDLRMRPPFEVAGDGFFSLPRGQSTNITVRYAPPAAGDASRQPIRPGLNDASGTQILFLGQSVAPFEAIAPAGDFVLDGHARETQVTLRSLATQPQDVTLTIDPPDLVDAPATIPLEAQAVRDIVLGIPAERKGERREVTLTFATPAHQEQLILHAPPVAAALALRTAMLDFTQRQPATVVVANTGGVPGRFYFDPVPGVIMDNGRGLDAREFVVPPDTKETVTLRLDLPRDTPAPNVLTIRLAGQDPVAIPVLAPEPLPSPTPKPAASPVITPPPAPRQPWILNQDIRVGETGRSIEWRSQKNGWSEPRLELVRDGVATTYRPPEPARGWMTRFGDWLSGFFGDLVPPPPDIQPDTAGEAEPPAPEWIMLEIDESTAADPSSRWVLTAVRKSSGQRENASREFQPRWTDNILEEIPSVEEAPSPQPPPTAPPAPDEADASDTTATMRSITPALKVESARAAPQRRSARIQIIFSRDTEADSYRLEHGFQQAMVDEKTGLPYAGDFLPQPHPDATVQVLGTTTMEHEGRELTVLVANVEGLAPGSASLWRVVTMAEGRDRWPTGEFQVHTLPPWQFPWRNALLAAAFLALAAVLYLRWRLNRPPG